MTCLGGLMVSETHTHTKADFCKEKCLGFSNKTNHRQSIYAQHDHAVSLSIQAPSFTSCALEFTFRFASLQGEFACKHFTHSSLIKRLICVQGLPPDSPSRLCLSVSPDLLIYLFFSPLESASRTVSRF